MPKGLARSYLKILLPIFVLLVGCGMTNRLSSLLVTPTPEPAATVATIIVPSPTAIVTSGEDEIAMGPTDTVATVQTPEQVLPPTLTATAEITVTVTLTPTQAPTATPTPTPGPYNFYLNSYAPKCPEDAPQADVQVVDAQGQPMPDIAVELLNGFLTPVATAVTNDEGRTVLLTGDDTIEGWVATVSDESGGGAVARSVKVQRPDLSCELPYSLGHPVPKSCPEERGHALA